MQRRHLISCIAALAVQTAGAQALPKPAPGQPEATSPRNAVKAKQQAAVTMPAKITFGLIALKNAEQTLADWAPFIEAMSKAVGIPVEAQALPMQGEMVDAFVQNRMQMAWVGNVPALELVESGIASVFAQEVGLKGEFSYRSVIITPSRSPIVSLDGLQSAKGRYVFSDGDPKSTSGHVIPRYYAFVRRGINDPESLFKEVRRGTLQENMNRVAAGEVDLATTNSNELEKFRTANPEQGKLLRPVWQSPDIPLSPLVWRNDLPAPLKAKLQAFATTYGSKDPAEKEALVKMKMTGFRKSNNAQLVMIADVEMFNARQRIMNDSKMAPEERAAKVDEAIKRGSKVELMLKQRPI